ncbi:MAG: ADP-ribosylglycohydrolase family protein, partial [Armatimonadetes bacterium]|nr:ADP-ribosylglycohydrolase family protein [Armatimonadota bacterium]
MAYPGIPKFHKCAEELELYAQLGHEYGARGMAPVLAAAERAGKDAVATVRKLPIDKELAKKEPNGLEAIKRLRPAGPRKVWSSFDKAIYGERLEGALIGRFAGCTLGAIVEGWGVQQMEDWAKEIGDAFPPTDYWSAIPNSHHRRYGVSRCDDYTRGKLNGVPVDDDITYTLLGLLVVEDFGLGFSIADNGRAWLKYLPHACTAEAVALENLKKGVPADRAAEKDNPYCEWIGADIRSDPWGYLAPGCPEFAADMAYRDAYVSHRRNGIYGEMYFSAVISAAFSVDDPIEALEMGLTEIPKDCSMAKAVRWALKAAPTITSYREARAAVDRKFRGMSNVHTINNACLTIFGLAIGGTDVTRVIGETVAMGLDNDCTAATAGSIVGAIVGKRRIPRKWTRKF